MLKKSSLTIISLIVFLSNIYSQEQAYDDLAGTWKLCLVVYESHVEQKVSGYIKFKDDSISINHTVSDMGTFSSVGSYFIDNDSIKVYLDQPTIEDGWVYPWTETSVQYKIMSPILIIEHDPIVMVLIKTEVPRNLDNAP